MPVKPAISCSVGLEVDVDGVAPVTTFAVEGLEVEVRLAGRSTGSRCEPPRPVGGRCSTVTVRTGDALTVVKWSPGRSAASAGAVPASEIEQAAITALHADRNFMPHLPVDEQDAAER